MFSNGHPHNVITSSLLGTVIRIATTSPWKAGLADANARRHPKMKHRS